MIKEVKGTIKLQNWTMEVKECQESGLTIKEWCKIKGIHFFTYYKHL